MNRLSLTLCFVAVCLCVSPAVSAGSDPVFNELYKKSEQSLDDGDRPRADFYLARLLAARETGKSVPDLELLLEKRRPEISGFLPLAWDAEFLRWFESSALRQWDVPADGIQEKLGSIEIGRASQNHYEAVIAAFPEIQSWFLTDTHGNSVKPIIVAAASSKKKPFLLVTRHTATAYKIFYTAKLPVGNRSLLHVWKPLIDDLDGDGTPEIWIRYDLAWGNGFAEKLEIYKIAANDRLELYREFFGENEGIARRIASTRVEVGTAFGSRSDLSRIEYDRHRLETFEFSEGKFKKTDSVEIPHLLKSPEWKKYYPEDAAAS